MDFVISLSQISKGIDSIWVIMDQLTKSAHFLPVWSTYSAEWLARVYIQEVVHLHRVPMCIILDRRSPIHI